MIKWRPLLLKDIRKRRQKVLQWKLYMRSRMKLLLLLADILNDVGSRSQSGNSRYISSAKARCMRGEKESEPLTTGNEQSKTNDKGLRAQEKL